jgi:hypothetical protein
MASVSEGPLLKGHRAAGVEVLPRPSLVVGDLRTFERLWRVAPILVAPSDMYAPSPKVGHLPSNGGPKREAVQVFPLFAPLQRHPLTFGSKGIGFGGRSMGSGEESCKYGVGGQGILQFDEPRDQADPSRLMFATAKRSLPPTSRGNFRTNR